MSGRVDRIDCHDAQQARATAVQRRHVCHPLEVSADAIAASQALLAKLNGSAFGLANGVEAEFDEPPGSEQTSDDRLQPG
jgi:hypothetical protein